MSKERISVREATAINAAGKYTKVILTVVVNAVLARILSSFDFGVVAVITVFTTFFATLSDMGLGAAIVQKKDLTERDINSLFTYSVYISLLLSGIFAACAFPIASFYDDALYLKPALLLTISLFFNALNMVPNGMLNKDKKFVVIAVRTVVVYVISALVAIYLALNGWKYYALVVQAILSSFLSFAWNWVTTRPRFLLRPSKESIAKVRSYSFYQFAFGIVNYFARNLDTLLTGKFFGEVKVGNYNKAYNLMLFPVNNLAGVISPVLHPILSDYQNDLRAVFTRYMHVVRVLFCIGIYASCLSYLASEEIVLVLYGDMWKKCIVCFRYLSIAIIPQMINASAGGIFQAIGNTKLLFISTCINTVVTVGAILFGVFVGGDVDSVALCVAISYIFHFVCAFYLLICRGFKYSILEFLKPLGKEFLILAVMILACALYANIMTMDEAISSLAAKSAYLMVIFLGLMLATGEYKLLFRNVNILS